MNWYETLDDKSHHCRQALREYIQNNNVNLENYCLPPETDSNNQGESSNQNNNKEEKKWNFPR